MLVERQTNMLVERRAPSRLCRKYCAVPPELDFVPLLLPGTDVPSFPVSPLRRWSNSAAHFFAGLGGATQTRLARPWAAGGRAGLPGSPPANAVTISRAFRIALDITHSTTPADR